MIYKSSLPGWFLVFPVTVPVGLELGAIFFGLCSVITLSFVVAWKLNENFHTTIKKSLVQPTRKLFHNSLFGMVLINSMTLITVLALNSIQEASGIPTGTTPTVGEPFLDFLDLSYSAVVEEIGFRLVPIGAFLLVLLLIDKKKDVTLSLKQKIKFFGLAFLFPDGAKRMVGKKTVAEHGIAGGINLAEWGIVIFTSLLFGFAHFNPGVSWEIGKISSATLAGFVLAITYLAYGAHAPLLMHWFFNAYNDAYFLFADLYPVVTPLANAVTILSVVLGLLGWLMLATLSYLKLARTIQNRKTKQSEQSYSESDSIS